MAGSLSNLRLEKGSTILITGITGYIGSWTAYSALELGYKVRGAVRSLERSAWLTKFLTSKFGEGSYEPVLLAEVTDTTALASAVKGVAGIIHIAVDSNLSPNPEPYIPNAISQTEAVLKAAAAESTVKSVVLTSSSMAAVAWTTGQKTEITKDAYNDGFINLAWDASFENEGKVWMVYAAAKAQSEQAAWKWIKENKPAFALNSVLPAANFGPALSVENQGYPSTGAWPKLLFDSDLSLIAGVPPQFFVDVRDTARIHVAALVDPNTANERLFDFAEPYNWNDVLAILRKLYPSQKFIDDIADLGRDETIPPNQSAEALLNVFGQAKFTSLEQSVKDTLANYVKH